MRGQKPFELPGHDRKFVAKELTVKQIRSLMDLEGLDGESIDDIVQHFGGRILPLATDLSLEEVDDFLPSELKIVWEKVREVNAVFFDIVKTAGVKEILIQLKNAVLADFLSSAVTSLSGAMSKSGTMDTAMSSEPSTPPSEASST
jgi:hypothetical protein